MIIGLPLYVSLVFGLTTAATLFLFYRGLRMSNAATTRKQSIHVLRFLISWLVIQGFLTQYVYSTDTDSVPPKIVLFGILPMILGTAVLFLTRKGKGFVDSLPLAGLTMINVVRIPVEVVLCWLFINGSVPEMMTFEGRNFDIIAGITAPLIAYFGVVKKK